MSFSTYAALKLALAAWYKPGTTLATSETTERIPEFIALAETEFNRVLKNREMEQLDNAFAIASGVGALPTGFVSVISLRLVDYPYTKLKPLPMDELEALNPENTDTPSFYAISGTSIVTSPATTATMRLRWRKGLTALSADGDTNWLLTNHPGAYLYGALRHADRRMILPERLALIEPGYAEVMAQLEMQARTYHEDGVQMMPSSTAVI